MNWKAYDEVHFSDQYILRWVREGDEYVNRISKEMMEDLHAVVRQQQAEIEALKKEAALQRLSDFTQEADNEPVAWRNLCVGNIGEDSEWIYNEIGKGEPLYTHPAKTLTDEEILNIAHQIRLIDRQTADDGHLYFARAVIKEVNGKC